MVNNIAKGKLAELAINEYAIYVDENNNIYLIAWNDKVLNEAVNKFMEMITAYGATVLENNKLYEYDAGFDISYPKLFNKVFAFSVNVNVSLFIDNSNALSG